MSDGSNAKVLTAGSINTDLVARVRRAPEAGETITGESFAIFGGGKGANQSLASVRSGVATSILSAVGDDDFGRQRLAELQRDNVDVDSVRVISEFPSGVAVITVEDGGENRISYMPGATLGVTACDAERAVMRVRPSAVLTTLELPPDALQALIDSAKAIGANVIINATPEPAAGANLARQADVLIVNSTEARELLGWGIDEDEWSSAASELRERGPQTVVITLGGDGVLVLGNREWRIPAPKVGVIDTTGAGDAFCGAFAAQIAQGATVDRAAQVGVIAGAIAVTKAGAQPSQPYWSEIAELLA